VEIVGHGGAGHYFPGNGRQSIEHALKMGVDRIEIDVQASADDTIVLLHDEHARIDGKKVAVRSLDVPALREHFDGLLTLAEAVELMGPDMPMIIDMKFAGYEPSLAREINKLGIAERSIVSSTYAWSLDLVRRKAKPVEVGLSLGHIANQKHLKRFPGFVMPAAGYGLPLPLIASARAIRARHIMLSYRAASPRLVRFIRRAGLGVFIWTVDEDAAIKSVAELEPNGIISNRPDLVREIISQS
jgi:glycerophosphoryl diester phosphodiesterase